MKKKVSFQKLTKSKSTLKKTKANIIRQSHQINTVHLTDLCLSQKIKIGELILILEERKQQNQFLTQENNKLRQLIRQYESKNTQLEEKYQQKNIQNLHLTTYIEELEQSYKTQKTEKHKFTIQLDQTLQKLRESQIKKSKIEYFNQTVQTVKTNILINSSTQTNQMNRQSDLMPLTTINYSKSFDKIMKAPLKQTYSKTVGLKAFLNQSQQRKSSDSEQESCGLLSRKWEQLKQQNRQSLQAKTKIQKDHIQKFAFLQSMPTQKQQIQNFDQQQLNKWLKSKNFCASKLMKLGGVSIDKTEKRSSESPQVSYLRSPSFNQNEQKLTTSGRKKQAYSSRQINFFESNLLQLAQSKDSQN